MLGYSDSNKDSGFPAAVGNPQSSKAFASGGLKNTM